MKAEAPDGWQVLPLGEVATLQRGYDLPVGQRQSGGVPIYAANGPIGTHNEAKVDGPGVITGRSGTIGKVHYAEGDFWPLNTSLFVKDFHGNHPRFIYHLLMSIRLERFHEGTGVPTLNRNNVHGEHVCLPPLPVQKRIAAILDAADALRAKRRETIEQLDSLVQATFLEMFGECKRPPASIGPPSFGSGAGFVPLSQVATLATGHTPDRACDDYWGGSIPWISLTDIRTLDGRVALNTLQCVTESGLANSSSVLLPKGTVCLSRTASIGFVTVMGRDMATSQDFVNWICGPKINPIYLMTALRQSRPYLLSKSAGSTHKTIYYRHAEEMEVYLPPLDLQTRFALIVESIEEQKARLKAHLTELDTLFASLQSRAFNGELVA